MNRKNTCSFGCFQVSSSRASRVCRRFAWGAGLAALALVVLAAPSAALAAIVFSDTSNLSTPWVTTLNQGSDIAFGASEAFTVTAAPGSSVLVVPVELYASSGTALIAGSTAVNWVVNGGTQQLQRAVLQVSAAGSQVYSEVYYMFNPPDGTGTITFSGSAREWAVNAYTLSLADTTVAPIPYVSTSTANNPATLALASSTVANSFAATSESYRLGSQTTWGFTSTTGNAVLPWKFVDPSGQVGFAAGYVSGVSGAATINSTPSGIGTRNQSAAAIFTSLLAPGGAMIWAGTAGNANWDIGVTKNWQSPTTLNYYIEPNNGVLFNDSAGTANNVVVAQAVAPSSVTFGNSSVPFTVTASGGGAISGGGSVTVSGGGLVNMNLANSYTGGTTVSSGTLSIGNANGSATGTGPVAIAAGATLSGNGFISTTGGNVVSVSGSITPDASPNINSFNTLTANALNLNSGSSLNLNFNTPLPGQHDLINVTSALTLASGIINIDAANLSGTWSPGAYTFANYGSLINGSPTFNIVNAGGALGSSQMSIDESVPGVISLDVLSAGASTTLSWVGNQNGGLWDIGNTVNWSNSGSASVYNEGNKVIFSNTASNFTVTVNQPVNPSGTTFSNNSSNNYTLNGSSGIASSPLGVVVNGGGTVTFNNPNVYTSATTVSNSSTLIVNGNLANSGVIVNNGSSIGGTGQLGATPTSLTLNGATALAAGSDLSVYGAANVPAGGTFTIPASATLSGTGGINVSTGAQVTLNGIVDVNQVVNLNGSLLTGSGTVNGGVNLTSGTLAPVGTLALNGTLSNSGTSVLGSGILAANGAWSGGGAVNVPSGADLLLESGASIAGLTLNVSGTLNNTSGGNVNSPVNVLGNGIANINAGTMPTLNAQGGTTSLAGATANVATVSGSNAVVSMTAGATVPVLNVVNSNLTLGVSADSTTTVGSTSLGVAGGLVTLNNINTIPTAALSGGTTNWAGPSGNTATISGSSTVVNITSGGVGTLIVNNSSLVGGVTVGASALVGNAAGGVTVAGGLVTLNNGNTIPIATLSGGTTNLNGPIVTAATVSGGSTVVNVTAGSVPTLTVNGSNPILGVNVSSGASVGTTALSVSGGLVNLHDFNDTIPTATLSGGTTNFFGPSVTTANVSGAALVNVNSGSVAMLNASGGTTTVASTATATNATVYGGLVNLNYTSGLSGLLVGGGRVNVSNTGALSLLAVSGGTVSLPAGTTTVATANFGSPGAASATVTPNPLVITNQLTFNNGASAAISGGTFSYVSSGNNMANTTAANTLTFSAGVLSLSPSLSPGPAINIFTGGNGQNQRYDGTGPSPDAGTNWNRPVINTTTNNLLNSNSAATTYTYTDANNGGTFNFAPASSTLLGTYGYGAGQTVTFGGLTPGGEYNLYAINNSNTPGRATIFTTGGTSQTVTTQANFATATFATAPTLYCEFPGQIANSSGQITVVATSPNNAEVDVNGYQLVPLNVLAGGVVNLPSTSIVAPAGSTLDFSGAGPANAIGGVSLAGNITVQNVASGGSVQLSGDVLTSANAAVTLASGAGSVPALVLSGNTNGIQNVSAANTTTLTLPATAISAATVRFGNTSGYDGAVVLGGATELTNGGGATVNLNAGTLKVESTLSGAAGASLTINNGTTLAGGPAGSIQVPVTLNGGGTLLPDATAASTALIGNSLTIGGGGALQWVYSSSGAEGTLALGSGSLVLSNFNIPVFRPQFVAVPPVGSYVMTWNTEPASQPAWSFDGSLTGVGHIAIWADSNGNWDTGSNWSYAVCTGATLSYEPAGLQITGLNVSNVAGTAPPVTGASVTIVPPSNSNVSVTGGSEAVSIGALVVEGSNGATASLALQGNGPLTATSVNVGAGGSLADDLGSGTGALIMPGGLLTISQGSVSLGNASTNIGAATMNSGVFSLSGGNVGTLTASGGAANIGGGTIASVGISGAAVLNATGGNVTLLTVNGGSATAGPSATLGSATISGGVVNLNNSNTMGNLMASGGATTLNGPTVTTATVSASAVVNITGGSVPTLNVLGSNLITGITAGAGATVGSTSLGVSGGLVTLNNTNTIPTAALSGGTTNLLGPMVTTANASGSALVNIGSAGTVATANVSSNAVINVNAANSVTAANVSGGQLNANVANAVSGPTTINGGTVKVADAGGLGLQQSTVSINANDSLIYSGPSATLGGLSGSGTFSLPSSTLSVGANSANSFFGGTMGGAGGLTKVGTGTLTLGSSNVYAGPTQVNAGTLKLVYGSSLAVNGFGDGSSWGVNSINNNTPAFTGGTLTITDLAGDPGPGQARSAWYGIPLQGASGFTASFIYTVGGNKTADGMTFGLQTDSRGTAALNGNSTGGNLGYNGITPSAAVAFNFYPAVSQTGFWTGGVLGSVTPTTGSVNLANANTDPIQVTLVYNGPNQTLTENLLDTVNNGTYSTTFTNVNIASILGGSTTAYIGFTGGDNATALQTINNFTFSIGGSSATPSILPATTPLLVSSAGTFDLDGNIQTVASLSDGIGGGGAVINSFSALPSVLTVSSTGGSTTFSGSIMGGGTLGTLGLTLSGSGTLVLAGTNTYTGNTIVEDSATLMTAFGDNEALPDGGNLFVGSATELSQFGAVESADVRTQAAPSAAAVPEPGTLALLAAGAAVAIATVRRGRRFRTICKH